MSILEKKDFIFIIGSPRSGTTWLQAMIGAHPLVCTTIELTLYSNYTAPWINAWNREAANISQGKWHQGLPFLWSENEFYGFLRRFLSEVYEKVAANNPAATHVLDKHPGYSHYLNDIIKLIPNSRFIHMIRDGRDVALSMVAAQQSMGFGTGTIPDSALDWAKHVKSAQKGNCFKDRYFEVRYEDLSVDADETLRGVFDFCGLSINTGDTKAIVEKYRFGNMKNNRFTPAVNIKAPDGAYRKGTVGDWRREFKPIQRYAFQKITGGLLIELGYAEHGWWAESRSQKYVLPLQSRLLSVLKRISRSIAELLGPKLIARIRETKLWRYLIK